MAIFEVAIVGAVFGAGFWSGIRWWSWRFAVSVYTSGEPLARDMREVFRKHGVGR